MSLATISLDLAKSVCRMHGVDVSSRVMLRQRHTLARAVARRTGRVVGMEACSNVHHWARGLVRLGHTVRLIPPQYVKLYANGAKHAAGRGLRAFVRVGDDHSGGHTSISGAHVPDLHNSFNFVAG